MLQAKDLTEQYGYERVPILTVFDIKMHWLKVRIRLRSERALADLKKRHPMVWKEEANADPRSD
jgi:hypothetical protein